MARPGPRPNLARRNAIYQVYKLFPDLSLREIGLKFPKDDGGAISPGRVWQIVHEERSRESAAALKPPEAVHA